MVTVSATEVISTDWKMPVHVSFLAVLSAVKVTEWYSGD
jgi:hypothetical protein